MYGPLQPQELQRELGGEKVLSVYLETQWRDPAMKHAWRALLTTRLRAARAEIADEAERARFDQAAAHLHAHGVPEGGAPNARGWAAFATSDGLHLAADLPVRPATLVAWREGPVLAPYLRALKQHRPVLVALVDARGARVLRYAWGALERVEETPLHREDQSGHGGASAQATRGTALPLARGAVDTEAARRRRVAEFRRFASSLGERLAALAGQDGWVLLGGPTEWVHLAAEAMPRQLEGRVKITTALDHHARPGEIAEAAKRAASGLRAVGGRGLVDQLLERAGAGGLAVVGARGTDGALGAGAVDLLLVTPTFIAAQPERAEDLVRAAMAQGAAVEVPSGVAADRLDRGASGVAARLRFLLEDRLGTDVTPEESMELGISAGAI